MKILACHNFYQQFGGEDVVFREETDLLEAHGTEVIRYTRHNDELQQTGRLAMARNTIWNRHIAADLRELIHRARPDVLHCTNTFPIISPSVYRTARRLGVAVVQSLHNYRVICPRAQLLRNDRVCAACVGKAVAWPGVVHGCYRESRAATAVVAAMLAWHKWRRTWHRDVDRFITPSEFARKKLIEGGLPAEKIVTKPNFVDLDSDGDDAKQHDGTSPNPHEPSSLPAAGNLQSRAGGGPYCVFVGRLSPEKGLTTLLEAWSQVAGSIRLKIVGDGPLRSQVQQAARRDPRIKWLGHQARAETMQCIRGALCLLMPSIAYETFGLCIIEAYAVGTPVIASRLGAMQELVEEGKSGLLGAPGDPRDWSGKIQQLVSDPGTCRAYGARARHLFQTRYTKQRNYRLLLDVYRQAMHQLQGDRTAVQAPVVDTRSVSSVTNSDLPR